MNFSINDDYILKLHGTFINMPKSLDFFLVSAAQNSQVAIYQNVQPSTGALHNIVI